jgi:hypothetical protein
MSTKAALGCWLVMLASPLCAEEWHPFLFSIGGHTLSANSAGVEGGVGYSGVTGGVGVHPEDARQVTAWASGAVALHDRVELDGTLLFGDDPNTGLRLQQTRVDVRVQVLRSQHLWISIGGGYQSDAFLENGLAALLAASATLGKLDVTLNVRAVHYLRPGSDPIDLFVTAGALFRVAPMLKIGAEYVGEELEAVTGDDDDGTGRGRHYFGPTAALLLLRDRLRLSATGGMVAAAGQTGPLARASLSYLF